LDSAAVSEPVPDVEHRSVGLLSAPVIYGVVVGVLQVLAPLAFWWLDAGVVWAAALIVIGSVYIGFAVADGRRKVLVVELLVASAFIVVGTVAMSGSPWWVVAGLIAHGLKDLWQHRTHFVANTRWWPPFCFVVDVVAAALTSAVLLGFVSLPGSR
jgi:hypothetical protein